MIDDRSEPLLTLRCDVDVVDKNHVPDFAVGQPLGTSDAAYRGWSVMMLLITKNIASPSLRCRDCWAQQIDIRYSLRSVMDYYMAND